MDNLQSLLEKHWHHLPGNEVVDLLDTDPDKGLDLLEVGNRQQAFGPNQLTPSAGESRLKRFFRQFHQPLVYILLISTAVMLLLQEWVDAGVIFGVVLVNAVIGYIQESKAINAIEALDKMMTRDAVVVRAGLKTLIPAAELVPGDIVLLESGDKVPADLRLLKSRELKIDESALTGESVPVEKQYDRLPHDTVLADRANMAFSSSLVTFGVARGVVIATGDNTEVGKISELISITNILETPLTRKIGHFSLILLYIIVAMAVVTFLVGIVRGENWVEMFMAAVALAVGAIPEGLPAAITITLAIGVSRMACRNAIIRRLPAVETLGSTTVICSDKTGTLTQNQMTVKALLSAGRLFQISGTGYVPDGDFFLENQKFESRSDLALTELLTAGIACNGAQVVKTEEGNWKLEGDPTEGAVIVSALKAGISHESINSDLPALDQIPFDSRYRYMATLHAIENQHKKIYLKGSFEAVSALCDSSFNNQGELVPYDLKETEKALEEMAREGMRVLAFACIDLPEEKETITHDDIRSGFTFLGLQGMIDPPRPEAIRAVKVCRKAGIQVKMITGDHAITAAAIARQMGLGNDNEELHVATGKELAQLTDHQLIELVERTVVFARVSPEQKLRLVEALQLKENIVAMTGDGVNDAPALRRADIGVAMGQTGTEVSKEAADMVLADDNFSSIEAAVEEGRGVFDNIIKFITWTLPTNVGEGLVILVAVLVGAALPVLPVQILWINMTTAILLGLMLAFEPKEEGIMLRYPRNPRAPILSNVLVVRIILVGFMLLAAAFGLFQLTLATGGSETEARTVAANVFVFGELFYLFNCRSLTLPLSKIGYFSNRWLLAGVIGMILLQLLFTYSPVMNRLFDTAPIGAVDWLLILGAGFLIYLVVKIEKWQREKSM